MKHRLILAGIFLALIFPSPARPSALGRLFFTPEQRAVLDVRRDLGFQPGNQDATGEQQITVNGQVRRSSGRHTTWINGHPRSEREPLPMGLARLKAGETLHLNHNRRTDLLQGGQLIISRSPPLPMAKP